MRILSMLIRWLDRANARLEERNQRKAGELMDKNAEMHRNLRELQRHYRQK